jgi:hypothetical protein
MTSFVQKNHQNQPESTSFSCCWLGGVPCLLVCFPSPLFLLSTRHSYTDVLINFQPTSCSVYTTLNQSFILSLIQSHSHSPPLKYCQQVTRNPWKTSYPCHSTSFTPNDCQDHPQWLDFHMLARAAQDLVHFSLSFLPHPTGSIHADTPVNF